MASGPNRHYIPQFLQRAFAIPSKAPKGRREIWKFETGKQPERRLIKNTGSGRFFYSDLTDDLITKLEERPVAMLAEIRGKAPGESVRAEAAAAIVSHLSGRTAHIRKTLRDILARSLQEAKSSLSKPSHIAAILGLNADVPTEQFRELVTDSMIQDPRIAALGIPPRIFERHAFFLLKENSELVWGPSLDLDSMFRAIDEYQSELAGNVRDSHDKALGEIISPAEHEVFLQTLDWGMLSPPEHGAILPDCVTVAIDQYGNASSHMFVGHERLGAVFMAVTPEKVLVGRKDGFVVPNEFNFNAAAAQFSHSFFLSPRNDDDTARLQSMIGEQLQVALKENLEAAIARRLGMSASKPLEDEHGTDRSSVAWAGTAPTAYELRFEGCNDEKEAQRIRGAISDMVAGFARIYEIERLDGITIASDYRGMIQSLDHISANTAPIETVSEKAAVGFGKTMLITGLDALKVRILVSDSVSEALISDSRDKASWGAHVLAKQLASVAWIGIVDKRIPGGLLAPIESQIDGWLYGNVHGSIKGYATSQMAATFGNGQEIANGLRELLVEGLNGMETKVLQARREYGRNGDMDKLLSSVLPIIQNVLTFAARLLGHCSTTNEPPFDEFGLLKSALEKGRLTNWFDWYQDHHERFSRRMGHWESFDDFLAFNIHVERLLLAAGLFPWEASDGVRIEVPGEAPGQTPSALYMMWQGWRKGILSNFAAD